MFCLNSFELFISTALEIAGLVFVTNFGRTNFGNLRYNCHFDISLTGVNFRLVLMVCPFKLQEIRFCRVCSTNLMKIIQQSAINFKKYI